jgi:ERF superfamily
MSYMENDLMSEKIDALAGALSKTQNSIENVNKNKQGYGYKYADLASCLSAIKKPLNDNGLSISQLVTHDENKQQVLVTLLMHESGQWLKSKFYIENVIMKQCNSLQQIGAGLTYARRYALSAIIGLSQEDDDAQSIPKMKTDELDNEKKEKITELLALCTEHKLGAKEFADFHHIDSNNFDTIKNALANFETLKESFITSKKGREKWNT